MSRAMRRQSLVQKPLAKTPSFRPSGAKPAPKQQSAAAAETARPKHFYDPVLRYFRDIVSELKKRHPDTPIIGFPKGAGGKLGAYAREVGADAIGLDETVDPAWADRELPASMPVQGNLDPLVLLAGGEPLESGVKRVLDALGSRPHVFNLGHGIGKETPIEHVERLVALVKGQ